MSRTLPLLAVLLLAPLPLAAADTIYKWIDEQGTVHYGERPPHGVDAVEVLVSSGPRRSTTEVAATPDPAFAPPNPDQPNAAQQQREQRAERLAEQREEEARLAAACQAHKSRLEQMIPRAKIVLQNPDGTSRMLEDEERQAMIDEAQAFVDENCD